MTNPYQKHLHLPANTQGHDYIVGDLHGCKKELDQLLTYIGFNTSTDRLFSVGDLIDRGPNSVDCANLMYNDWFYLTLGNHELLMIQSILKRDPQYMKCWIDNGGLWHHDYLHDDLYQLAFDMGHHPMITSVGEGIDRFNIVHAELYMIDHYHVINPIDNSFIDEWKFNKPAEDNMLWGRNIIDSHWSKALKTPYFSNTQYHTKDLSPTYVGHSTYGTMDVAQIQQHIYLDTGCCFQSKLSIASPTRGFLFQKQTNGLLTTKELSNIKKINSVE